MSRSHNNNYVVNILVFSLIFAFGILSALNIVLIKNVSTILQKTQVLQEDLSHEISLTKKCIDKIDNRHDQELLKKVINSSNNTLIGVDYEGKIFAWSNGALEMLGYTKSEIVGKSLHSLIPDALKDTHRQKFISKINDPTDTQIFESNHCLAFLSIHHSYSYRGFTYSVLLFAVCKTPFFFSLVLQFYENTWFFVPVQIINVKSYGVPYEF